jgi:hypothetical protein
MDDKNKRKNISIILIVLFVLFSLLLFVNRDKPKELKNNGQQQKQEIEYKPIAEPDKETPIDTEEPKKEEPEKEIDLNGYITPEIKSNLDDITNKFFNAYLPSDTTTLESRLNVLEGITSSNYYERLEGSLSLNKTKKNPKYDTRIVKDVSIIKYEAVNDGSIISNVKVQAEWVDADKNHTDDEDVNYIMQFIQENGAWKIISVK